MKYPVYEISEVTPLMNRDYVSYLLDAISSAKWRIWAMIFIADVRPNNDMNQSIRWLIKNLSYAKWKNVDIKIIIGKSDKTLNIDIADITTVKYIKEHDLPVKIFNSSEDYSLHSKYIILDKKKIILGSHNWSDGSFNRYIEDSIAVISSDLTYELTKEFLEVWETSIEVD